VAKELKMNLIAELNARFAVVELLLGEGEKDGA